MPSSKANVPLTNKSIPPYQGRIEQVLLKLGIAVLAAYPVKLSQLNMVFCRFKTIFSERLLS